MAPATTPETSSSYSGTTTTTTNTTSSTDVASNTTSSNLSGTPTTTTDNNGTTTTTMPNGTSVTRSSTTTVVYPDGTVHTIPGDSSQTSSSSLSTTSTSTVGQVPAVPPGAAVVTKTVTTIKTQPATTQVSQLAPQPIYITTTPANVYQQPPMTSSTTTNTIYQPYRSGRGRRFPGVNFLVFADRASFSNSNSSLNGTVNTGQFSSDIRNENGWGGGVNFYLGRTNLSTEFTYSNIQPRATLTPSNTAFQPITNFRFKMQPVTGTLQLHFNPRSSVDFYLGGGGAYVMFKPSNSFNPGTTGLTAVRFRDEWGPLVNAGLGFGFSPNFGINFDAKYMWVRANATPTFNDAVIGNVGNSSRVGVNPFIISAGLRFGF